MFAPISRFIARPIFLRRPQVQTPCASVLAVRSKRYEAFDASYDQDALNEARAWYQSFDESKLPSGQTTYARSSGPGGQHVNKTETKAITVYSIRELISVLPPSLHGSLRNSKYYTANNDSLTFHAQTSRSRTSNTEENRQKLIDEVTRIYHESTPSETSAEKKKKHQDMYATFPHNSPPACD
jgi:peptidyl-tRNA hydrolase ICT1